MDKNSYIEDIICARATAAGTCAISVIRVSGKNCHRILNMIFSPNKSVPEYETQRFYYGRIVEDDRIIDDVIILVFGEGSSFTGEESFEINCHGSEVVASLIIKLLMSNGARIAEPGEFSKRAYLNGRMDLMEAESIIDLVNSSTEKSALIAVRQLTGRLSDEINSIKTGLSDLLAEIEVNIDYPEDDIQMEISGWAIKVININESINILIKGFGRGRYYREGLHAVILGKTNSGKSTLFNYLLNQDKAIVSDIHGTTRDYLDGLINVSDYGVRIFDTAGLRESADPIEREGARRAMELASGANMIIYVVAANEGYTADDILNISRLPEDKKILIAINKSDLANDINLAAINKIREEPFYDKKRMAIINLSALNKSGIEDFNRAFTGLLIDEKGEEKSDPLVTNERHAALLTDAKASLDNTVNRLREQCLDLAAFDLREALNRLGELTGQVTSDDIINKIFSNFCVGK